MWLCAARILSPAHNCFVGGPRGNRLLLPDICWRLAECLPCVAGFRLAPSEAERLLQHVAVDADGCIDRVAFTASLLDWRLLQEQHLDDWLEIAKTTFEHLDQDCDGVISVDELVNCLRQKVPEAEVRRCRLLSPWFILALVLLP
jgi:hypothetical protein